MNLILDIIPETDQSFSRIEALQIWNLHRLKAHLTRCQHPSLLMHFLNVMNKIESSGLPPPSCPIKVDVHWAHHCQQHLEAETQCYSRRSELLILERWPKNHYLQVIWFLCKKKKAYVSETEKLSSVKWPVQLTPHVKHFFHMCGVTANYTI